MFLAKGDDGSDVLPEFYLHFKYNGAFSNKQMDHLLNEILSIEGLPDADYSVYVHADGYVKETTEEYLSYNEDVYGNLQSKFGGRITIDKDGKE
ncbi:hypothetical protein J9303_16585 [Bacillaceae bacterium Marseille-Q3522]|nr:hypothetical protein [Bacillaceae bacterium Marseille-Q3522]